MFGDGSVVTGGRVPVAGSGMLGSAVAGCVILCRVIVYRTGGGGVVGGGVVGCAVTLYRATFRLIGRQQNTVLGNRVLRIIQGLLRGTF